MRWISALFIIVVAAGCQGLELDRFGKKDQAESSPPAHETHSASAVLDAAKQADTSADAQRQVMAYVNGSPIYMESLHDLLILANGRKAAQNLVAWKLVDQEAAKRGITVTEADIDAQHEVTLARMFPQVSDRSGQENLLQQLMTREAVPDRQWRMSMRMQAQLTKILSPEIQVTDKERQEAFADKYGRQVVVRHIQSATLAEAEQALWQLRDGADFAQLARKVSKNASAANGGLLPPISANPKVLPVALHKAAWSMDTVGQISDPIQAGTSYHILYLEKVIEPKNVAFEDVTGELDSAVKRSKMRPAKDRFLQPLIADADIKWMDPVLQQQTARPAEQTWMEQP